jgi:hypothetical protein
MSVISDSGQPVTWSVIAQQEVTGQDSSGDYVPGVRVSFRLNTGTVGSIFVPSAMYTEEVVARRINNAAARLANVDSLSGTIY